MPTCTPGLPGRASCPRHARTHHPIRRAGLQFLSSTLTFGIGLCWMCVTFSWSACHLQLKNDQTDKSDMVLGDAFVVSLIGMFASFLLFYVKFKVFCQKDANGNRGYQRTSNDVGARRTSSSVI